MRFSGHTMATFPVKCMENPPLAPHPPPPPTHPTSARPSPTNLIHDIGEAWKKVSENPAVLAS